MAKRKSRPPQGPKGTRKKKSTRKKKMLELREQQCASPLAEFQCTEKTDAIVDNLLANMTYHQSLDVVNFD